MFSINSAANHSDSASCVLDRLDRMTQELDHLWLILCSFMLFLS